MELEILQHPMGLAALLGLVLYVLVKDVMVPLVRRRNGHNGNPGPSYSCPCPEITELMATVKAQWEEYLRDRARAERNIEIIFTRLEGSRGESIERRG